MQDDEDDLQPVGHVALARMEAVEREDWNRKYDEGGLLFGVEPNRFLVAEVEGLAPGRALDLACGAGRNAVWLAEQGWTVLGADFSDVALDNARRLAAERGVEVEWIRADLREWAPAGPLIRSRRRALPPDTGGGAAGRRSRGRPRRSLPAARCSSSATTSRT